MTTTSLREIAGTIQSQHTIEGGGFNVRRPFPTAQLDQIDPFLLIHHHANHMPAGTDRWNAGVGPHPHRGFSPVTFMWSGGVHHRDSRGNNSVVDDGGVQWMDAGLGIIHSERPPAKLAEEGGMQEIIQIATDKHNGLYDITKHI